MITKYMYVSHDHRYNPTKRTKCVTSLNDDLAGAFNHASTVSAGHRVRELALLIKYLTIIWWELQRMHV